MVLLDYMFSVSDLLQPECPDPDPVSDHGRRHARAGAHPGRGGGAQGRLQHQGDSGEQEQMQVSQGFRLSSTYDINVQTYLQGWSDISAGWRPGEVRGGGGQIHRSVPGGTAAVRDAVHRTVQVTLIISTPLSPTRRLSRLRDSTTVSDTSSKRYIITAPPSDFVLLPTDMVSEHYKQDH